MAGGCALVDMARHHVTTIEENVEIGRRIEIWGSHDVSINGTLAHGEHMNIA